VKLLGFTTNTAMPLSVKIRQRWCRHRYIIQTKPPNHVWRFSWCMGQPSCSWARRTGSPQGWNVAHLVSGWVSRRQRIACRDCFWPF